MKTIREYAFPELGFFSPDTCERIKKAMDGRDMDITGIVEIISY